MTKILFRHEVDELTLIEEARQALENQGVVVVPTDTIPGIGCSARDHRAVSRVYKLKQRPSNLPIPVILGDTGDVELYARDIPAAFYRLADCYWPGPLTIVLWSNGQIDRLTAGGGETIGFRVPNHDLLRNIARETGLPIALTSANPHSLEPSSLLTTILEWWNGKVELIILDVEVQPALPSVVVDLTKSPARVLREGAISAAELLALIEGSGPCPK